MTSDIRWKVKDLFKVLGIIFALLIAANLVLFLFDIDEERPGTFFIVGFLIVQHIIFLAPVFFLIFKKYGLSIQDFGLRPIRFRTLIKWILKGIGAFVLMLIALGTILTQVKIPGFSPQTPYLPLFGETGADRIAAGIMLIVVSPIVEEIFFRGFFLQTLLSRMKPWVASALVAAVFALIHLEFQSIGIIFLLALIINWLYIRSRSIYPGIGFHILNNSLAFLVEIYIKV